MKSQCCLHGDVSLLEATELLTKLPAADLFSVMSCKVKKKEHSVPVRSFNMDHSCNNSLLYLYKYVKEINLFLFFSPTQGFQPLPVVSMSEFGGAEVNTRSGVSLVGHGLAGDP